jgi:hypothetical protein
MDISIAATLHSHLARYPSLQLADVYKLIHQAALGSAHAIHDAESARNRLARELAEMGAGPDEPLFDPLSDETGIVRVHLRPFLAQGGDPAQLLAAFLRTANEFHGVTQTLERYWDIAASLGCFPDGDMQAFLRPLRAQNYPALHHSPEYERLYRPAYRVIKRDHLAKQET